MMQADTLRPNNLLALLCQLCFACSAVEKAKYVLDNSTVYRYLEANKCTNKYILFKPAIPDCAE